MYPDWLYEDYAVYKAESRACGYEYLTFAEWAGDPADYEDDEE